VLHPTFTFGIQPEVRIAPQNVHFWALHQKIPFLPNYGKTIVKEVGDKTFDKASRKVSCSRGAYCTNGKKVLPFSKHHVRRWKQISDLAAGWGTSRFFEDVLLTVINEKFLIDLVKLLQF